MTRNHVSQYSRDRLPQLLSISKSFYIYTQFGSVHFPIYIKPSPFKKHSLRVGVNDLSLYILAPELILHDSMQPTPGSTTSLLILNLNTEIELEPVSFTCRGKISLTL